MANCHDFNFDQIYALFGVNSFSPEIMLMVCFRHLEGLLQIGLSKGFHFLGTSVKNRRGRPG